MTDATTRASELPSNQAPPKLTPRIAALEAELAALTEAEPRALVQLELGSLFSREGDDDAAVRHLLAAYQDAGSAPALRALVDIFERRRSLTNLERLYKTIAKASETPEAEARALVDVALLRRATADEAPEETLGRALALSPADAYVAVAAELAARATGDEPGRAHALEARIAAADDARLRALLLLEQAEARVQADDRVGAAAALDDALATGAERARVARTAERVARAIGDEALLARALAVDTGASGSSRVGELAGLKARMGELDEARAMLDRAIADDPDDAALRLQQAGVCARQGDLDLATEHVRGLLERLDVGPLRAPLLARLAERGGPDAAALAAEATSLAPDSAIVAARVARLFRRQGDLEALVAARLGAGGEPADADAALEAAHLLAHGLGDLERAEPLYLRAAEASADPTAALRERYGASFALGTPEARVRAARALLERPLDEEEQSALLYELTGALAGPAADPNGALDTLTTAIESSQAAAWAADLGRVLGAQAARYDLIDAGHASLAASSDGEARAAHLAGAARSALVAGDAERAEAGARAILEHAPHHPYGGALLEHLLRARGAHADADALIEQRASEAGAEGRELALLLAGARAEADKDHDAAISSYERAAEASPTSPGPLWALYRLGDRLERPGLQDAALRRLAALEADAGAAGTASLLRAEADILLEARPEAAVDALARLRGESTTAEDAAWLRLLAAGGSSDGEALVAATETIAQAAEGEDIVLLGLELAQAALAAGDDATALRALALLPEPDLDGEPASITAAEAYARLRLSAMSVDAREDRATSLVALADSIDTAGVAGELYLHALRAALADGAAEDAFLWAQTLASMDTGGVDAIIAQGETVGPGDDLDAYADWAASHLSHGGVPELNAAAARALGQSGRDREAFDALVDALTADPDDLASLEAMRVTARAVGELGRVGAACEKLAQAAAGPMRARLLEEAGAVCMDALADDDAALRHFRAALESDPDSELAYGRVHDLLAEQGEDRALLELVEARIAREDAEEPLAKLYYEKARLLRSLGEREAALAALEELSMLDASHVGGIALSVEIHVARGDYAAAVRALREISAAHVPPQQKKVARLGAADFLEHRLGDPRAALDELCAVDALGLADAAVYTRMADLAERIDELAQTATFLERAAEASFEQDAAALYRRAAALHASTLNDPASAEAALRRALGAEPLDLASFDELVELVPDAGARLIVVNDFEAAGRARLRPEALDPQAIRAIRQAAVARGDKDLAQASLGTLAAIGIANESERKLLDENTAIIRRVRPKTGLGDSVLTRLAADGLRTSPYAELARLASDAFLAADALEADRFGVGRAELVAGRQQSKLREELSDITQAFELELGDIYFGGPKPTQLVALPGKRASLHWVAGGRIDAPLDTPVRFHAGRQVAGACGRMLPLVNRAPGDAAALLYAAAAAAGAPLPASDGRPGVTEWTRAIDKVLSRKARKSIAEWAAKTGADGAAVLAYCQAARTTALRAGLLVSADLYGTLKLLLGSEPTWERVQASRDACELVVFWLSREAVSLRHDLGVTS